MRATDRTDALTSPSHLYDGYGLVIASDVPLPELHAADDPVHAPDVTIRIGLLPEVGSGQGPPGAKQIGPFLWAAAQRFWFCVPGVARFRISAGRDVVIEPDPAGDEDGIRVFLLGTALGVLLMQRGNLMLHGNAVRVGDGCVICVGPSGAGKSTLAAAFHRRGFALLTDDLVMVDDAQRVAPGVPRIKLWADAALAMAIDVAPLRRIRPGLEKYSYRPGSGYERQSIPARALYALGTTNAQAVTVRRLDGFARFGDIHANVYRPQFVDALALRQRYLTLCTRLAAAIPMARISRPLTDFSVDQVIDAILEDLGDPG